MPRTDSDSRAGAGRVAPGSVRQATLSIPAGCLCTWIVVKAGPGMECVSELRYRHLACSVRHVPSLTVVPWAGG